jgi:hypothetical protein
LSGSRIFHTGRHLEIEQAIVQLFNAQPTLWSPQTISSTRAVGDTLQAILSENFAMLLGDLCADYSAVFARRAMADLAFTDVDGLYYIVDVKTHRLGTHFNMPNLTSVERLARFYEDDENYFCLVIVKYAVEENHLQIQQAHFVPIEFLAWECLTIGALGWGQIQIANANNIRINLSYSRRQWMLEFCDAVLAFYPREMGKIAERIEHFKQVREKWESRGA